jgi:hypothetical protein
MGVVSSDSGVTTNNSCPEICLLARSAIINSHARDVDLANSRAQEKKSTENQNYWIIRQKTGKFHTAFYGLKTEKDPIKRFKIYHARIVDISCSKLVPDEILCRVLSTR